MILAFLFNLPASACEETSVRELSQVGSPSILVLGERHGSIPDLRRAARIVRRIAKRKPVTVALEAVAMDRQSALDKLARGEVRASDIRELAEWDKTWRHDFEAYRKLLAVKGVTFVAAGPPLEKKPEEASIPVPEAYEARLRDVALGHGMSEEDVPAFAASMAWRDYRIAELAVDGWNEQSVLIVVAGRGHVQGGLGIGWQFDQGLARQPWQTALLAPSEDCGEADRYLP